MDVYFAHDVRIDVATCCKWTFNYEPIVRWWHRPRSFRWGNPPCRPCRTRTERDERGRSAYIELFRAASLIHLNKSWHSRSEGSSYGYYDGGRGSRPFRLIAHDGAFSTRDVAILRNDDSKIDERFVFEYLTRNNSMCMKTKLRKYSQAAIWRT